MFLGCLGLVTGRTGWLAVVYGVTSIEPDRANVVYLCGDLDIAYGTEGIALEHLSAEL